MSEPTSLQIKRGSGQCALCRAQDKAHVRRKFYDIHAALGSPIALEALERIGRLYKVEEEIRGRQPHERHAVRQARAGPELKSLHEWLHKTATTLSKKSELAKAIRYALLNWVALTRYCEDGRLEIDNNAAERALRAVALGRNYVRLTIMHGRCRILSGLRGYRHRIKVVGPARRRRARAPAVHNHKLFRNCSVRSVARYRSGLVAGGLSVANARAFIVRSASTY